MVAYRLINRRVLGNSSGDVQWALQVVGLNVLLQLAVRSIDGWGHLGGAIGGAVLVALLGPRLRWERGALRDRPPLPLLREK